MRDLPVVGVLCIALPAYSGHLGFITSGMKASLWVACLVALASISKCLGAFCLKTFLRSACLEWLYQTLCMYARYLDVSTLHTFKIDVISLASSLVVSTKIEDLFM
jgi:hypothetical protein